MYTQADTDVHTPEPALRDADVGTEGLKNMFIWWGGNLNICSLVLEQSYAEQILHPDMKDGGGNGENK